MEYGRNDPTDNQRDRGHYFEIDERFYADATEAFQVAHPRNSGDYGGKYDRRNHHPDEANEGIAEGFEFRGVEGEIGAEKMER